MDRTSTIGTDVGWISGTAKPGTKPRAREPFRAKRTARDVACERPKQPHEPVARMDKAPYVVRTAITARDATVTRYEAAATRKTASIASAPNAEPASPYWTRRFILVGIAGVQRVLACWPKPMREAKAETAKAPATIVRNDRATMSITAIPVALRNCAPRRTRPVSSWPSPLQRPLCDYRRLVRKSAFLAVPRRASHHERGGTLGGARPKGTRRSKTLLESICSGRRIATARS